jgi:hypothetical protein
MKFSQIGKTGKNSQRMFEGAVINAMKPLLNGKMAHCSEITWDVRPWYISKGMWVNYVYRRHHSFKKERSRKTKDRETFNKTSDGPLGPGRFMGTGKVSWSRDYKGNS